MTFSVALAALSLTGLLVGVGRSEDAEQNLIVNGGFEQRSPLSPPPGWTMWGAPKYKIPANYTRDTRQPHSGEACFRIHHPAGTEGYIVSSSESAIRPKAGMMYTLSFWARADQPGDAVFGWTAYRSVQPFVDAPSPGSFPIGVDRQWREFRFALYEGWDFFAEDCRYLLLTFKVNRNANISGMMHRAVRLIHYLREGMLRGASSWEPLLERKEDLVGNLPVSLDGPRLAFTLPPHAVAFITLLQHQDMAGPFRGSGTIGWWKGLARPEMIEKALRGLPGSDG